MSALRRLRSASGTYRFNAAGATFFGSPMVHFIVRDGAIVGRFGRTGTMRGSLSGLLAHVWWQMRDREGWVTLHFEPHFKSCVCEYGLRDGPAVGSSSMSIVSRSSRAQRL
jgi:hypothetical protein